MACPLLLLRVMDVNGRATKARKTFRMECGVAINISASSDKIWALMTNAADFPRWNTTVESIEGTIALGEKIKLKVPIAPGRTFKLKVAEMVDKERMVWKDGAPPMFKGVRTYTLSPKADGTTDFAMVEVFTGLMLPMIAGSLPDFGPSFEKYAADLKQEAEKKS